MKLKEIIPIVRKRFEKINTVYRSLIIQFDAEDIHDFRVEVKKLKAFLRLAGMAGAANLKLPKKLRELYRVTGTLRNLHLQQQNVREACLAKGIESPDHYLDDLSTEAAAQVKLAERLVKGKRSFRKEERRIVAHLPAWPRKRSAERFVYSHNRKIRHLLTAPFPTDETLHSIRKDLKDLQYTKDYTERYAGQPVFFLQRPACRPLTYTEIGSFTGLLGDLQDLCIGIELLQPEQINQRIPEKEKMDLLALRHQWQEKKKQKKEEIYVLLRKKFLSCQDRRSMTAATDQFA